MSSSKPKRHTPEQVIAKLREAEAMLASGKAIVQVCQALEVSHRPSTGRLGKSFEPALHANQTHGRRRETCVPAAGAGAEASALRLSAVAHEMS